MKVSIMLFSLLVACQVLPVALRSAAAQSADQVSADVTDLTRAAIADLFDPESLRVAYNFAVIRPKALGNRPLAYTYDVVTDTAMVLAGGNALKSQVKASYAYDKDGRSRTVSSAAGLERIVIADPTTQTVYLVCPERKEVLRMRGAALASPPGTAPAWHVSDADKSDIRTELGEKEIAGVKASGTRSEVAIPAGTRGNDKALVQTSETWYSPDLATVVYSHISSPDFGDVLIHVENLKFGDVPASTFALPEGYSVRDIALAKNDAK